MSSLTGNQICGKKSCWMKVITQYVTEINQEVAVSHWSYFVLSHRCRIKCFLKKINKFFRRINISFFNKKKENYKKINFHILIACHPLSILIIPPLEARTTSSFLFHTHLLFICLLFAYFIFTFNFNLLSNYVSSKSSMLMNE
jgi:hypothetical protein